MNLEVLQKGNELHDTIKVLTSKLSSLKSAPHGAVDLNILGVKFGKTVREHIGHITLTSDQISPEINALMQKRV